jgi:phosphoglycolate phosphatase
VVFKNKKIVVDAVMFDLDGTLIDSVPLYYRIIDTSFDQTGLPPVSKEMLLEAMKDGEFNWDVLLPPVAKDEKEALIVSVRNVINDISLPIFQEENKLFPNAVEVLNQIDRAGLKMGLVTSALKITMDLKIKPLQDAKVLELFQVVMDGDDVEKKKPHAEPLVTCSRRLGVSPDRCVYVGDTRVDIMAGKAAGVKTISVLSGFDSYETLKNEKPDAIIDSIEQLNTVINF